MSAIRSTTCARVLGYSDAREYLHAARGPIAAALVLSFVAILAGTSPLGASGIGAPPQLFWRVARSEVIALGRVGSRTDNVPSPGDSIPGHHPVVFSRYAFVVSEVWKGDVRAGDTISLLRNGGLLPGGRLRVAYSGEPEISPGETFVLFLERRSDSWRNEMDFNGSDGYVRVAKGKGRGSHCPGKSIKWLKKRVNAAIETADEKAPEGRR